MHWDDNLDAVAVIDEDRMVAIKAIEADTGECVMELDGPYPWSLLDSVQAF